MKLKILLTSFLFIASVAVATDAIGAERDGRLCRNLIIEGNSLFEKGRWSEAEVKYQKALEADPTSQVAQFNLASALLRQGRASELNDEKSTMSRACNIFKSMSADPKNSTILPELIEKSFYNLGNVAYETQNYQQAVDMYKGALRVNPSNNYARENLRLAQQKLKEQQNQDKDKEKEKEKEKEQNKDKQQQPENNQDKPQQQPQQPQGGISDQSAEQILKTMENEEAATRRRVQAQQGRQGSGVRVTGNPW